VAVYGVGLLIHSSYTTQRDTTQVAGGGAGATDEPVIRRHQAGWVRRPRV